MASPTPLAVQRFFEYNALIWHFAPCSITMLERDQIRNAGSPSPACTPASYNNAPDPIRFLTQAGFSPASNRSSSASEPILCLIRGLLGEQQASWQDFGVTLRTSWTAQICVIPTSPFVIRLGQRVPYLTHQFFLIDRLNLCRSTTTTPLFRPQQPCIHPTPPA